MLLSVIPLCATFAHSRNLLLVGVGGMGLLAMFLYRLPDLLRNEPRVTRWGRIAVAAALVATHLVIAPIRLWQVTSFRESWPLRVHLPEALELNGKTIVIVNGPANFFAAHFPLERDAAGLSVPAIMRVISPSVTAMTVERPSEQMLRLSAQDGWLANPLDLLSRSLARPFVRGDRVDLGDVRVDVIQVSRDGRPLIVTCRFRQRLEDPSLVWVAFTKGAYRKWQPPAIGGRVDLPLSVPW